MLNSWLWEGVCVWDWWKSVKNSPKLHWGVSFWSHLHLLMCIHFWGWDCEWRRAPRWTYTCRWEHNGMRQLAPDRYTRLLGLLVSRMQTTFDTFIHSDVTQHDNGRPLNSAGDVGNKNNDDQYTVNSIKKCKKFVGKCEGWVSLTILVTWNHVIYTNNMFAD